MDGDIISCMPGNPFRRPAWRWNRAAYLSADKTRPACPEVDDEWVTSAVAHLDAERCGTGSGINRPMPQDFTLDDAIRLRDDALATVRWRLESLVLAGEPVEAIAQQCRLTIAVVETYESLFFDVRAGLAAPDWIATQVLDGMVPERLRQAAPGSLWRVAGYYGGCAVLEVVIAVTMGWPLPPESMRRLPAGFADTVSHERSLRQSCERWIAMLTAEMPSDVAVIGEELVAAVEHDPQLAGEQFERFRLQCEMLLLTAGVSDSSSFEALRPRPNWRMASRIRRLTAKSLWPSK